MANAAHGRDAWTPDVREWEDAQRREASIAVLALGGVLLAVAIVFYVLGGQAAAWTVPTVVVGLVVLLVVEGAIVATGVATETERGPPWLRADAPGGAGSGRTAGTGTAAAQTTEAAASAGSSGTGGQAVREGSKPGPRLDLRCPQCTETFTVEDTGERPLEVTCPHCGVAGKVDPGPTSPTAGEEDGPGGDRAGSAGATGSVDPGEGAAGDAADTVSLQCPACGTRFETEDTGERPLRTTCTGCGRQGKLR